MQATSLNAETMSTVYRSALASISANLSAEADILVYGCDFGAGDAGARASAMLAALTGADVASSDDLTGAADLGGDWELEQAQGEIDVKALSATDWDQTLAPLVISTTAQPTVTGAGGVGTTVVWANAGTVGGVAVDLRATVTAFVPGFAGATTPIFGTVGDNPYAQLTQQSEVTLKWEIFQAGTNFAIQAFGAPNWTIKDIDGIGGVPNTRESIAPDLRNLQSYTLDNPTNIQVTFVAGDARAAGTQDQNSESTSAVAFQWSDVQSWEITYRLWINDPLIQARFEHDGNGNFAFVAPTTTQLLTLDLDANNSAATGTAYQATYTENGAGIRVVDSDITISQNAALGTTLGSARVVLTNAQAGDVLSVGTPPAGIGYTIDTSVPGQITVNLTRSASVASYQTALQAITFSNSTDTPSTTDRNITVSATNGTYGTTANVAVSTIRVTAINDVPAAVNDGPVTVVPGVSTSIAVLGNDTDADGDTLSVSQINGTAVAVGGSVTLATGTVVTRNADGTLGVVMVPGANNTETFTYQVSDGNGGTSTATVTLNRDTDGDGATNANDIDDDNDGILDTVENVVSERLTGSTFPTTGGNTNVVPGWTVGGTTNTSGPWTAGVGKVLLGVDGLEFRRDGLTVTTLSQNVSGINPGASIDISNLYWRKTSPGDGDAATRSTLQISYGGVVYATIDMTTGPTPTITATNGASPDHASDARASRLI